MKKIKFKLKSGQIDFTHARWAPVVNCVLSYKGKILLVQRSSTLNFYPGYWNGVSGFLDDHRSLQEKVVDEVGEEVGIPKTKIKSIVCGEIFHQDAPKYKKTWIVHPVLVEVATDDVTLDWEAGAYKWVTVRDAKHLKLMPGFKRVLEKLYKKHT
ncbi:MAG: NUDIX hydrolase [Parcubacteria group bacterium Gr01-1014_29]|nr:MAG: NUDIX hydrolase [Parcubacteria group bacterium Gr01-1014_29]